MHILAYAELVKLFSTNPDEFAWISVGQLAWGVFAFGQLARGFVAVGQLAIGVVAVGQAAVGVVGGGMAGAGVLWFAGIGVGARGYCIRLVPAVATRIKDPPESSLDAIWRGHPGLLRLDVLPAQGVGLPALGHRGQILPVKLTPSASAALADGWPSLGGSVFARLRRQRSFFVCDQLTVPGSAPRRGMPAALQAMRLVALVALAAVWWFVFDKFVLSA